MLKWLISIILFSVLSSSPIFAQSDDSWVHVRNASFSNPAYAKRHITFLFPKSRNPVIKYNPAVLVMSSLMYVYQSVISVQISSGCSYEVSCSEFSKCAIKEFGLVKGMALSADRMSRCNQLAAYDLIVSDLDFEKQKVRDDLSQYRWKH